MTQKAGYAGRMRNFYVFIILFVAIGTVNADCGDESWLVKPEEIDAKVLSSLTAVMTLSAENGDQKEITVYDFKKSTFTAIAKIPVGKIRGVSHAPTCRPPGNPLDGLRLPILDVQGDYVLAVLDPRFGSSIWIRPGEIGTHYVLQISSISKHSYINSSFNPGPAGHRVYQNPDDEKVYTMLPKEYGVLGVLQQKGDFIQVGLPYGEGGVAPIGWIKIRNESGQLTVWPWHYDSC